jgi:hypothetical protein
VFPLACGERAGYRFNLLPLGYASLQKDFHSIPNTVRRKITVKYMINNGLIKENLSWKRKPSKQTCQIYINLATKLAKFI